MDVASLARPYVASVPANASARAAAEVMRSSHVGALVVTDPFEPGRVVGIVTDRDLVIELIAQGRDTRQEPIGACVHEHLVGVPAHASVMEAIATMRRHGVRRVLLMKEGGTVAGLVSADDLLDALAEELSGLAGALRSGLQREDERMQADVAAPDYQLPQTVYLPRNEP